MSEETRTSGALITDPGDPEAGIPEQVWEISGDFVFEHERDRYYQRKALIVAFTDIAGDGVGVIFNDEFPAASEEP